MGNIILRATNFPFDQISNSFAPPAPCDLYYTRDFDCFLYWSCDCFAPLIDCSNPLNNNATRLIVLIALVIFLLRVNTHGDSRGALVKKSARDQVASFSCRAEFQRRRNYCSAPGLIFCAFWLCALQSEKFSSAFYGPGPPSLSGIAEFALFIYINPHAVSRNQKCFEWEIGGKKLKRALLVSPGRQAEPSTLLSGFARATPLFRLFLMPVHLRNQRWAEYQIRRIWRFAIKGCRPVA